MEYVYAVSDIHELLRYQRYCAEIHSKLQNFLSFLEQTYHTAELPKCIVFSSLETATQRISNIPLPAYTNEHRTVFCPEISVWKQIYLRQLDKIDHPDVRQYYEQKLSEHNILQILGHEFVHHSELFIDEAFEKAQWFEEGMCEYISRRYFLTDDEFREEARINRLLINLFERLYNPQSLEDFRMEIYCNTYAAIFYLYWKSFHAVNSIVQRFGGDVSAVFREYKRWYDTSPSTPLSEWFRLTEKDIL